MANGKIRIQFVNQDGGGFAGHVEVNPGTTAVQFFHDKFSGKKSADYRIRINGLLAGLDDVLQEGDRVSITPIQVKGAA